MGARKPKLAYRPLEACEATGISRATLYKARARGELVMHLKDGCVVIYADELERWLRSATPLPPTGAPRRGRPRKVPRGPKTD